MKKYIIFILLSFFIKYINAQSLTWEWAKSVSCLGDSYYKNITIDSEGNICVIGVYSSNKIILDTITLTMSNYSYGAYSYFLAKYNSNGNVLWAKNISCQDIDCQSSNIPLMIDIYDNIFIGSTKYDKNGNLIWSKELNITVNDIVSDNHGNIFITGYYSSSELKLDSTTFYNDGNYDFVLIKLDNDGNIIFAKTATDGIYKDYGSKIVIDIDDNIWVGGSFQSPKLTFETLSIQNNNVPLLSGGTELAHNIFITKYDKTGNVILSKSAGNFGPSSVTDLLFDQFNNLNVIGQYSGIFSIDKDSLPSTISNCYIFSIDSLGTLLWNRQVLGKAYGSSIDASIDKNGNTYITGWFESDEIVFNGIIYPNFKRKDIFIVKNNNKGNTVWGTVLGGAEEDRGICIKTNGVIGEIIIAGGFGSPNINFGKYNLSSNALNYFESNPFIAKFKDTSLDISKNKFESYYKLFPNPTRNLLIIDVTDETSIEILDAMGCSVYKNHNINFQQYIDMSKFQSGIYFVKIISNNNFKIEKIIKQ